MIAFLRTHPWLGLPTLLLILTPFVWWWIAPPIPLWLPFAVVAAISALWLGWATRAWS